MSEGIAGDLDYLTARLHGRRSRLADGARLEGLCRLLGLAELGRALHPGTEVGSAGAFQRRLAEDLVRELSGFLKHLGGEKADLVAWMLVRFQLENIKVLLRGLLCRTPLEKPDVYLLPLPRSLTLNVPALASAGSVEKFTELLPRGAPRKSLSEALGIYHDRPGPFFLEGALDRGYFQELLLRAEHLSGEDKELILPIVSQEVDAFHLMLAVRGRFHYGLAPELLLPLHVRGSGIPNERFKTMLASPDIASVASLALGRAIDALPSERGLGEASATMDASVLEALAWSRFLRLSNRAFRCSHMGFGAVVGYIGIRRVEVANLITLSEGMVAGMSMETLRARLLRRAQPYPQPAYV